MKVLFISLMSLAYCQVQAQQGTGVISGVITSDSSGAPITNATIALTNTAFVTHTDQKGAYRLAKIPAGVYELRISASGFRGMLYEDLTVPNGIHHVFSIRLRSDVGNSHIFSTTRLGPLPPAPSIKEDRILIYQPDSTMDFKLKIVNPEKSVDSSGTRRK